MKTPKCDTRFVRRFRNRPDTHSQPTCAGSSFHTLKSIVQNNSETDADVGIEQQLVQCYHPLPGILYLQTASEHCWSRTKYKSFVAPQGHTQHTDRCLWSHSKHTGSCVAYRKFHFFRFQLRLQGWANVTRFSCSFHLSFSSFRPSFLFSLFFHFFPLFMLMQYNTSFPW
jgi:hypothetical protein